MTFHISNEITIQSPTKEVSDYIKNNLILDNPKYIQNERLGFSNYNTPKVNRYFVRDGNDFIIPFGCIDDLMPIIKQYTFTTTFADNPQSYVRKSDIKLYDYQQLAVDNMYKARNGILISPTGSGKTIMGMALIGEIGQRTLWITHTVDLLNQAKESYIKMYDVAENDIGEIKEGNIEIGNKITFALVQTLSRTTLDKQLFGAIICDEVQFAIQSVDNTAMFSACMSMFSARYKYGLTALLHRADKQEKRINMLFGHIVYEVPKEAVADKITTAIVVPVYTQVPESFDYLDVDGTLDFNALQNYLAVDNTRNTHITDLLHRDLKAGHSCIVLCDRVSQIDDIVSRLDKDIAIGIDGTTNKKIRSKALDDMRTKDKRCLVASVKLAGAGLDIKCLDRLYWVSVQKDRGIVTQAVGRIRRTDTDKQTPIVYDFVDQNIGYCVTAFKRRKTTYKKLQLRIGV